MDVRFIMLVFLVGALAGAIMTNIIRDHRAGTGTLYIDLSDPNKDVYRLEINELERLYKKKEVTLKVDTSASLSQK